MTDRDSRSSDLTGFAVQFIFGTDANDNKTDFMLAAAAASQRRDPNKRVHVPRRHRG